MTTLTAETLSGANGTLETTLRTLVSGHNAGAYELPLAIVEAIRAADILSRRSRTLGSELYQLEQGGASAVETRAQAAAMKAGRAGRVPDDAADPVLEVEARMARLRIEAPFIDRTARNATSELGALLQDQAESIGAALERALAETLDAAALHAPAIAAVDLTDAAALMRATRAAQEAYGALETLAVRHDRIRSAAVALRAYALRWRGIEAFLGPGSGIDTPRPGGAFLDGARPYRFSPTGHPVARLAEAARTAVTAAKTTYVVGSYGDF